MNLDDLKPDWQQRQSELAESDIDDVASRVVQGASRFQRAVLRRDILETVAGFAGAGVLGFFLLYGGDWPWLMGLGIMIAMLGVIEVVIVLHWTRTRDERVRPDLPLAEFCAAELSRVDRQLWLLRHINWWYSAPILCGCCIATCGALFPVLEVSMVTSGLGLLAACGSFAAVGWIIYRWNQHGIRTQLLPLREELVAVQESLQDEPSNGDTE